MILGRNFTDHPVGKGSAISHSVLHQSIFQVFLFTRNKFTCYDVSSWDFRVFPFLPASAPVLPDTSPGVLLCVFDVLSVLLHDDVDLIIGQTERFQFVTIHGFSPSSAYAFVRGRFPQRSPDYAPAGEFVYAKGTAKAVP